MRGWVCFSFTLPAAMSHRLMEKRKVFSACMGEECSVPTAKLASMTSQLLHATGVEMSHLTAVPRPAEEHRLPAPPSWVILLSANNLALITSGAELDDLQSSGVFWLKQDSCGEWSFLGQAVACCYQLPLETIVLSWSVLLGWSLRFKPESNAKVGKTMSSQKRDKVSCLSLGPII